jgi:hypothetical protein
LQQDPGGLVPRVKKIIRYAIADDLLHLPDEPARGRGRSLSSF